MKKIRIYIVILLSLVISIGCNEKNEYPSDIETIRVDVDKLKKEIDASFLVNTDSFEIVPLETSDSSLIADITRIYLREDKIIIYDEMQKAAVIFNRDGSYRSKVLRIGQGPEEYPPVVNDIVVTKNHIGVLVPVIQKIKLYNFDGEFVKDISLRDCWGRTFFTFDEDEYYLVNDWSSSDSGNYHLFKINENKKISQDLPFKTKVNRGWGLKNYYSLFENRALVIYSTLDLIYSVTPEQEIRPEYYVDITKRKLPRKLAEGDGRTALEEAIENNYITGIDRIMESSRYIVLISSDDFHIIYDKVDQEVKEIGNILQVPAWGDFSFVLGASGFIQEDKMIYVMEALYPKYLKEGFNESNYEDKKFAQEYGKILNAGINEMDNPILFIFNVKK